MCASAEHKYAPIDAYIQRDPQHNHVFSMHLEPCVSLATEHLYVMTSESTANLSCGSWLAP